MKYFLLLTSIGCFIMAVACATHYQSEPQPPTPREVSQTTEGEPGFVHK